MRPQRDAGSDASGGAVAGMLRLPSQIRRQPSGTTREAPVIKRSAFATIHLSLPWVRAAALVIWDAGLHTPTRNGRV